MNDEIEVIIENKKIILVEGLSGVGKSTYIKKRIGNILDNENTIVMHGDRIRPYVKENVEQYFQENKSLLYKTLMTTVEDTMIIDGLIHTTEYDLIGGFELSQVELLKYYTELFREINSSCFLVYVCTKNFEKTIDDTLSERKDKRKDWLEGMKSFLEISPLAKQNRWIGEEGIKSFLKYINGYNKYLYDNLCLNKQKYMRE